MNTKKSQKPISLNLHLKYRCPNKDCGYDHWLSLKETQTKSFKVVCDCGCVFSPKRIDTVKVKYCKPIIKTTPQTVSHNSIVLDKCIKALMNYGFSKDESQNLASKAHNMTGSEDLSLVMKKCLQLIGEQKNV